MSGNFRTLLSALLGHLTHLPVERLVAVRRKAPVVAPFNDTGFRAPWPLARRLLHVLISPPGDGNI